MSFGSPACDYVENSLDLNRFLISHPVATYFMKMQGDALKNAGIFNGDILVVDKSIRPRHGQIVVAFVDGQRLVKRLYRRNGRVALLAENPRYQPLEIHEDQELVVWGVVVGKFKRFGS